MLFTDLDGKAGMEETTVVIGGNKDTNEFYSGPGSIFFNENYNLNKQTKQTNQQTKQNKQSNANKNQQTKPSKRNDNVNIINRCAKGCIAATICI